MYERGGCIYLIHRVGVCFASCTSLCGSAIHGTGISRLGDDIRMGFAHLLWNGLIGGVCIGLTRIDRMDGISNVSVQKFRKDVGLPAVRHRKIIHEGKINVVSGNKHFQKMLATHAMANTSYVALHAFTTKRML